MLKTIKTTKHMRLDELIKHIFEEKIKADKNLIKYQSNFYTVVEVDMSGQIAIYGRHFGNELFTVEVEEEITEDTELDCVISVDSDGYTFKTFNTTIDYLNSIYSDLVQILANIDGKYRTIWERED